jgi:hypothetical protein
MPVEVTRLEPKLYLNVSSRAVKMAEIKDAVQEMARMATEHNDEYYVIISDASAMTNIPLDIRALRALADLDPRLIAMLLVKPPYLATVAVNIISRVSSLIFENYQSREAALERAHEILRAKEQKLPEKDNV